MRIDSTHQRTAGRRILRAGGTVLGALLLGVTLLGAGCQNPNGQGVQDFGSVTGRLVDDRTNVPVNVSPIYISAGSAVVSQVDNQGGFVLPHVPVGKQTITINAIGYRSTTVDVNVVKDTASDAGYVKITSTLAQ